MLFLYSEEFSAAILPLRILIWVLPLMFLSELLGNIVVVHNRETKVALSIGVSTTVNLILNLIFIPRFGLKAASVITVFTEAELVPSTCGCCARNWRPSIASQSSSSRRWQQPSWEWLHGHFGD